jgi:hypothetical protein
MATLNFQPSDDLNRAVSIRQNRRCLLSFSRGKDSIAAWLNLRRFFDEIIPVHLYLVPGLSFVDESLAYYERFFGCRIINMPHPSLYRWLNHLTFQAPENCSIIERAALPEFDYSDAFRVVREDNHLPADLHYATGVRAKDSPQRWSAMQTHGPESHTLLKWHCIYDWSKAQMLESITTAGVQLPVDYWMFGRSFDGLDYRFLEPVSRFYPDDYRRILELFPLADLELYKMQRRQYHV